MMWEKCSLFWKVDPFPSSLYNKRGGISLEKLLKNIEILL